MKYTIALTAPEWGVIHGALAAGIASMERTQRSRTFTEMEEKVLANFKSAHDEIERAIVSAITGVPATPPPPAY